MAAAAGCRTVVLTNAAGGLRLGMRAGQPVLISDHLNLTARSPLVGARFVDLTDLYSPRLRALARSADPSLEEGVYAALPGPHFETPAEIRMLRGLGADLVGMSTVLEAIAGRGPRASRCSASRWSPTSPPGMTGEPLNHEEVLAAGTRRRDPDGHPARHRDRGDLKDMAEFGAHPQARPGRRAVGARHRRRRAHRADRPAPGWPPAAGRCAGWTRSRSTAWTGWPTRRW